MVVFIVYKQRFKEVIIPLMKEILCQALYEQLWMYFERIIRFLS